MDIATIKSRLKTYTGINTTEIETLVDNHIDEVQDLHICRNVFGHQFSFLVGRSVINLTPAYSTGTVTVTQDSTTVTGAGTTFTSDMVDRVFKVGTGDEQYRISAFVSTTELTLEKAYIGSTATAQAYNIYKIFYPLEATFGNMIVMKQLNSPQQVIPLSSLPYANVYPDEFNAGTGEIAGYILSGEEDNENMWVRFTPIQTTRKRVHYEFYKYLTSAVTADSEIPSRWHPLFIYKLAEIVYARHDMAQKATMEERKFNNLLMTFIKNDRRVQQDRSEVMSDELMADRRSMPNLPDEYPGYY